MNIENPSFKERIIQYHGKSIIVRFSVDRCTHVAECLRGLPQVFNTRKKPWVSPDAEPADDVAEVIMRCPTGALHFERLDGGTAESIPQQNNIMLLESGPAFIRGNIEIRQSDGTLVLKESRMSLCRCGASQHKPFCDGLHAISGYEDSESITPSPGLQKDPVPDGDPLIIILRPNGPYNIKGPFSMGREDSSDVFFGNHAILCRCGGTKHSPICDNSHSRIGFRTD